MPAAASGCLAAAKRGRLSKRQWADIGKAARIARAHGVQLTVHGITITAACSKEQPRFAADAAWPLQQQPAEPAVPQPEPQKDEGNPPPPPSKKQRRSQQRLAEFQAKKRATLIASSPRVRCFLRQFRWQRMQRVWTEWSAQQMQEQQMQEQRAVDEHRSRLRPTLSAIPFVAAAVRNRATWRELDRAAHASRMRTTLEWEIPRIAEAQLLAQFLALLRRNLDHATVLADWRG